MIENEVEYCFMEVSSHGIHQKRTEGLHFVGGVFTNLSHDHLDYHATFAEYRDVKKSFFDITSLDPNEKDDIDSEYNDIDLDDDDDDDDKYKTLRYNYITTILEEYKTGIEGATSVEDKTLITRETQAKINLLEIRTDGLKEIIKLLLHHTLLPMLTLVVVLGFILVAHLGTLILT